MIIRARQEGNTVIFNLEGHLDFETIIEFEQTCTRVLSQGTRPRIIINMQELRFVGSSGINQFVKVLKTINHKDLKPKIVNVSTEFEKILRALQSVRNPFDIFENETQGLLAFDMVPA
ncbi:anti-sigma factor antagonist [bacterium]|nr:anti-sigma factor antagonist [bacterium]NBX83809.1 anti-sigma factor antagonist [bacterium]